MGHTKDVMMEWKENEYGTKSSIPSWSKSTE